MRHASVYSASKKKTVWRDCLVLEGLERSRGLAFAKRVSKPLVIKFASTGRRRNALHSLFCPPFDAVFADTRGVVVDVVENISPNSLAVVPRAPCAFVIEVAPGEGRRVAMGEKILLRPYKNSH